MLELTHTFEPALERAGERARSAGVLTAKDQEAILALPGFDGGHYHRFLQSLEQAGVTIEETEKDDVSDEVELGKIRRERSRDRDERSEDIDLLDRYLADLGRFPPLTIEEEQRFAREARDGNAESRHKLILGNLRLVVFIARRYRGRGLTFLDLISEGNLGLIRGADRFDPDRGVRFSTYVSWWIRQSILRGIADQSAAVRLPTTVLQQMRRYVQQERRLRHHLGREANALEVGAALGLSQQQTERLAGLVQNARSLDDFELSEAMGEIGDLQLDGRPESVEETVEARLDQERLEIFLKRLSEREETILRMRYGFHDGVAHTLQQTGDRFGITRERVRQLEKRALLKLRRWLEEGGQAA